MEHKSIRASFTVPPLGQVLELVASERRFYERMEGVLRKVSRIETLLVRHEMQSYWRTHHRHLVADSANWGPKYQTCGGLS